MCSRISGLTLSACLALTVLCADNLPPWTPGTLDIHQIATGLGNSTLIICPDGTSIMIDAGASNYRPGLCSPPRPDGSRRPGEWIGRYALRQLRATGRVELDYFVATHLHPDHVGDVGNDTPAAPAGTFVLSGITDVAAILPIRKLIDRGFPNYAYPAPFAAPFANNYRAYVAWRRAQGEACEQLRAGAADQIELRHERAGYPGFTVRNLAANGSVWTGEGDTAQSAVPTLEQLARKDSPDENMCSIALRFSYGKFDFYTGGDLACSTADDTQSWRDVETPVARATGPVEVAVANHHGYFDAVGPEAVRALQPRAWIVPAWHVTHPGIAQLERMLSERLYPGPRDVFITDLTEASALLNQRFLPRVGSISGHVVVRVEPGGENFRIFITENGDEADMIKASFGPYSSR
jgi:beta-lactamase superfamily II metal-dependent hydrolase